MPKNSQLRPKQAVRTLRHLISSEVKNPFPDFAFLLCLLIYHFLRELSLSTRSSGVQRSPYSWPSIPPPPLPLGFSSWEATLVEKASTGAPLNTQVM